MSFRKEKKHSLIGVNYSEFNAEQLQNLSSTVLENGMHGLCFRPYGKDHYLTIVIDHFLMIILQIIRS